MSEEDLEVLITLDDPEGAPEEDIFKHLPAENAARDQPDQRIEAVRQSNRENRV